MRETPNGDGPDNSVWAHAACGSTLYRFDAQTGKVWSGGGQSSIYIPGLPNLFNYVAGSTMETVNDSVTHDTVAFLGVNQDPATSASYLLALDLETGALLWFEEAPPSQHPEDSPFHGPFPIAETSAGAYVLIAAQAGTKDGAYILGIPLG